MLRPHFEILSPAQRALWPELAEIPRHFVLYGGSALALRLGHRQSEDFDFFSSEDITPSQLLGTLGLLKGVKVIQNVSRTLTVIVNRVGPVKLSFFAKLDLGRVGTPDPTEDGVANVASLLDIAGTKAAVVCQRAERKDYIDILAIVNQGISVDQAMAAARSIYGDQYNPILTRKALGYFGDGDLSKLSADQKNHLIQITSNSLLTLPNIPRMADRISP